MTITKPSSFLMYVVEGTNIRGNIPNKSETRELYIKGSKSDSCRKAEMQAENAKKAAFTSKTIPIYRNTT